MKVNPHIDESAKSVYDERAMQTDSQHSKRGKKAAEGAYREQRSVIVAKVLVSIILLGAVAAVTAGLYLYVDGQERKTFENEVSSKVCENF